MRIVIEKSKPDKERRLTGVVRIRPEAEMLVQTLCIQEDMKASEIVSKIIVAAAPYVKFVDDATVVLEE